MYGQATKLRDSKTERTEVVEVFMAGDVCHAKRAVREFCYQSPCCVTVTPTTYIYRGGEEEGFVVAFRNYPRFPAASGSIRELAINLAKRLIDELSQDSAMVVESGGVTEWMTRRAQ
jgi:hypothetical protein